MNGAQKRTKHIWKGLRGKKYRYLTIAIPSPLIKDIVG